MADNSAATVRHLSKDHIVIAPGKGYSVTVFTLGQVAGGDVEALVAADDGSETIRLLVAGPREDQAMMLRTRADRAVSIIYTKKPDVR
jgi:hypothetical protein